MDAVAHVLTCTSSYMYRMHNMKIEANFTFKEFCYFIGMVTLGNLVFEQMLWWGGGGGENSAQKKAQFLLARSASHCLGVHFS